MIITIIFFFIAWVIISASYWSVFLKAGITGWFALIPGLNLYLLIKISGKPSWFFLLILIPFVDIVVFYLVCAEISKKFGRSSGFGIGLFLLSFIFWPILGFGDSKYLNKPLPNFSITSITLYSFIFNLFILQVVLQLFRPSKNIQEGIAANHISAKYTMPSDVNTILEKACNDCHSNNSRYPWYFNIQPIGMWMNEHIKDGKKELNFSEYASKRPRYQYNKMKETIDQIKEGEMPLDSYTWTHKDAVLTQDEKNKLIDWANSVMEKLKTQYPVDSLERKKPS